MEEQQIQIDNTTVRSLAWTDVTVLVKDRRRCEETAIISNVEGIVQAGELLAIMGPS